MKKPELPSVDDKSNPLIFLFAKMWKYSEGNRKKVVWYWTMFIVTISISLFCLPLLWAKIMDTVQKNGITQESIGRLLQLLALTLFIEFFFWCFHGPARLIEQLNAFKARVNYRKHLLKGVMTLPLEWHSEHHSGDTIDKIEKGTRSLFEFSEGSFEIIYGLVLLAGSYSMLVYLSYPAAFIVLAMILTTVFITTRFDKILIAQYKELNHSENQISESMFDAISNIGTVVVLRVEQLIYRAIIGKVEKPFPLFKRNICLNELKWFLTSMCCAVMTVAVLAVYFWQNLGVKEGILIGNIFLLIKYLEKISEQFYRFTYMYSDILKRKSRLLNSEELAKDFREESFTNHVLPSDWKVLEINRLNFSYGKEGNGDHHLKNIFLSIGRGEKVALVGETGSGKTTFLKIMRNLYHPQSLELKIDGNNVPEGFEGICRAISLIPQNSEIFTTTILGNITIGAEHSMESVRFFTDIARFTEVVERLPRKFDSSIKEKGVNLSGGEQQRLALTRGLLASQDKEIVLLDEPTSNIDPDNAMKIYQNIFKGFPGKTIISSLHSLHLLHLFDRIVMFRDGQIIGSGSLGELLEKCSEFKTLWKQCDKTLS